MKTTTERSEYDINADDFLRRAGITFKVQFLRSGPMWNDKEPRDQYRATFSRNTDTGRTDTRRQLVIEPFGQSIARSSTARSRGTAPSAYDILSCITKSDPGSHAEWCSDFGYDTDSRKGMDTYIAVQDEWSRVRAFFTAEELVQVQEIN